MSRWSNWMNWPWTNYYNQLLGESALKRSLKQEELRLLLWISFFIQLNAQQFNCLFQPKQEHHKQNPNRKYVVPVVHRKDTKYFFINLIKL